MSFFPDGIILYNGDFMYYVGHLTKKKKFFQKPYVISGNDIYITDTKHGKRKFVKSGITNVVFCEELKENLFPGRALKPMYAYDAEFLGKFVESTVIHMISFLKMELPVEEICVFSADCAQIASRYAKMVTVVGEGEDRIIDGVSIRYVKKIKTLPKLAITFSNEYPSVLQGVPCINLSENAQRSTLATTWKTMSFKCSLFPFEISAASLIYLIKTGEEFDYELTSLRKKSPTLLSFC